MEIIKIKRMPLSLRVENELSKMLLLKIKNISYIEEKWLSSKHVYRVNIFRQDLFACSVQTYKKIRLALAIEKLKQIEVV